jgi:hypothetical protein
MKRFLTAFRRLLSRPFDGYAITLRAPRLEGDHYVGLEPAVYLALLDA